MFGSYTTQGGKQLLRNTLFAVRSGCYILYYTTAWTLQRSLLCLIISETLILPINNQSLLCWVPIEI